MYVVGRRIRLLGPLDDPPLARTVDKQIRFEDVVGHQVFVERDLEGQGFVPLPLFLKDPAEPLRGMRLAPKVLQFFSDLQCRFMCLLASAS